MASFRLETPDYPTAILEAREAANRQLEAMAKVLPRWHDAPSPSEFRAWRQQGTHGFAKPAQDPAAITVTIPPLQEAQGQQPSESHHVRLRCIRGTSHDNGALLWLHGGGWVIGGAAQQDSVLRTMAERLSMVVVAVEYRLAPEHPFPACARDCLAAALYCLSPEGRATLRAPLRVIAGDSAGAYLSIKTTLSLRDRGIDVRAQLFALVLLYGIYSLLPTPSLQTHTREIVLSKADMARFTEAAFPPAQFPPSALTDPEISMLNADLRSLPPAFMLVGTQDPLVDDTMLLGTRYYMADNEVTVRLEKEAGHAFITIPSGEVSETGMQAVLEFLESRVARTPS